MCVCVHDGLFVARFPIHLATMTFLPHTITPTHPQPKQASIHRYRILDVLLFTFFFIVQLNLHHSSRFLVPTTHTHISPTFITACFVNVWGVPH